MKTFFFPAMIAIDTNCSGPRDVNIIFVVLVDMKIFFFNDDYHRYELLRPGGRLFVSVPDFPT